MPSWRMKSDDDWQSHFLNNAEKFESIQTIRSSCLCFYGRRVYTLDTLANVREIHSTFVYLLDRLEE